MSRRTGVLNKVDSKGIIEKLWIKKIESLQNIQYIWHMTSPCTQMYLIVLEIGYIKQNQKNGRIRIMNNYVGQMRFLVTKDLAW